MTVADFKAAFPEFANATDELVEIEIARAELRTPASVWTDEVTRDEGIGLRAAHSLTLSPAGRDMQLAPDGTTVYMLRLEELYSVVAGGARVL